MRVLLYVTLLLGSVLRGYSQRPIEMSLKDCVKYALDNNEQIKNSQLDRNIADAEVRKTTAQGFPQVTLDGELNHNFDPQSNLLDVSNFSDAPPGTESEVSFVQNYDGNVSFSVDQLIFDGSYFVGLKAARTYKELSNKDKIKTEIDVVEAVSKAYYNALITVEQLELLDKNLGRLDTLLVETRQMHEAGFAEKIDVDRIQVNYNNVKVERSRLGQLKDISKKLLKFQMGMDLSQAIMLTESLEEVEVESSSLMVNGFNYHQRIEYERLSTSERLAYLDMKNNRTKYLPKLDAQLRYGWNTATAESSKLFEGRRWLDFGTVGISASISIFDGFLISNQIQQNKLEIQKIQNQKQYLQKNIDLEIEQSRVNLTSQLETLDVQKQNVVLAQDIYNITKVKYQEGVGSNLEVIDADTSLKEAQTNYLNALYEAITAQIELKKALGILHNNH